MRWRWLIVLVSLLGCVASGSMISPHVQSLVDPGLSYTQIVARPETHVGKVVIVAGTIVEAVNTQEGTRLVLLQYPTSSRGRPKTDEPSGGRFLVLTSESLETAIIAQDAPLRWLAKCVDNGNSLSVRRSIVIPSWRHVKCISGLRVVAVPRSSTLVLALG